MKWIEVSPIPVKRRARFSWHTGKAYTDTSTKADLLRISNSWDGKFYETEALALLIHVYQKLPDTKAKRMHSDQFTIKPDVDNILKAVMDGLNGRAYADDKQIVVVIVRKHPRTREIQGECIKYALVPIEEVESGII